MTGATLGFPHVKVAIAATAVFGVVSFAARFVDQAAPNQNTDWINWLATAAFSACCALIAIIYRSILRNIHEDKEATHKRLAVLETNQRNLTELHALLVGVIPGAPGGMLGDLDALKKREREMTTELTKLKIQIALLEAAITTIPDAIVKLQKETEKKNKTES